MNVLEKILEEIKERIKKLKEADNMCRVNAERNRNFESVKYFQSLMFATERAESIIGDIIRSHMDEVSGMCGKRLIDANALDEEVRNFFLAITGDPSQAMVVRECKESFRRIIDEQPTVYKANDWIPCNKRLPEEHDSTFAIYKYTHLWSKSMFEKVSDPVNITYELEDGTRKTGTSYTLDGKWKIEKENRIVKMKVVAWQPLPEGYKGE